MFFPNVKKKCQKNEEMEILPARDCKARPFLTTNRNTQELDQLSVINIKSCIELSSKVYMKLGIEQYPYQ